MNKVGIFSDPHLGLNRRAHTTAGSRENLARDLFYQAVGIANGLHNEGVATLCLGDLFDKSNNTEFTIAQGISVASECHLVLGGNHDVTNRKGTVCSFEIVETACRNTEFVQPEVGNMKYQGRYLEEAEVGVWAIPHQSSQQLFDEAVETIIAQSDENMEGKLEIVILHCNYECGYADNEISLNLTSEQADKLLDRFDYVFIGHEHESRVLKDGRLIITGNTHPTSFSDISDKFVWYITEDNEVVSKKIWDKESGYIQFDVREAYTDKSEGYSFISVEGELSQEDYVGMADFMVKLWAANPQALMIRNNVKVKTSDNVEEVGLTEIDNLPAHIKEELKDDEEMLETFNEYLEKVQ